ncbi:MAG: hypothetical protein AAGD11_06400 [Planctomycetota bacterium]
MGGLRKLLGIILVGSVLAGSSARSVYGDYDIDFDAGLWIPFLPDYTAGSIVQGSVAQQTDLFQDDQTELGAQVGLSGFVNRPGADTRIEYDFDLAGVGDMGSSATYADPTPGSVWFASLDGSGGPAVLATAAGETATFTLDSSVFYNSQYVGLASTHFFHGQSRQPIELGLGFRHLGFDQEFALDAQFLNESGQYLEDLDTNYLGGEVRGSIQRVHHGRKWVFDFGVGFFNMNSEYYGQSYIRNTVGTVLDNDVVVDEIDEFAVTLDLALRLDTEVHGMSVRPGITFQYISDMPFIEHPMTEVPNSVPAFISTDSGYFLGINVELAMLTCRCRCR